MSTLARCAAWGPPENPDLWTLFWLYSFPGVECDFTACVLREAEGAECRGKTKFRPRSLHTRLPFLWVDATTRAT